ncbi:MAG TPA: periplasmic heavy metal sensor [Xanthobacteraceae bacterium]|nr:periplasmic heavy metal sensor [Xanthobacteraceae bacterium]
MQPILHNLEGAARVRWLLLGSLALNLFFVGAAGAVALRYSSEVPLAAVTRIDHSASQRLERLAGTLPATDAQMMREQLRADAQRVAAAQADLRLSQDKYRNSLRAEPFDRDAMLTAMAEVQTAREKFDLVLHDVIAAAVPKMSMVGRNKLADWPTARRDTTPR